MVKSMEGAVGVEPTFAVPVTAKNLEDSPDYAPMIGLTFRASGWGWDELYSDTESERQDDSAPNEEGEDGAVVDQRVIGFWCHVHTCYCYRRSFGRVREIPSARSLP
jgi:hypothetical protein